MTAANSYAIYYFSRVEQLDAECCELFFKIEMIVKSDRKCGPFSEL